MIEESVARSFVLETYLVGCQLAGATEARASSRPTTERIAPRPWSSWGRRRKFARVGGAACAKVGADMSATTSNPLQATVSWLATNTRFPVSRLSAPAEALLCVAALAEAAQAGENARFLVQRKDGAKDAALRAHAMRRSQVHYKCDNSAKV